MTQGYHKVEFIFAAKRKRVDPDKGQSTATWPQSRVSFSISRVTYAGGTSVP
ncbi:15855_t:CDS:2 [Funneliformis caledonium]|uniref:15855_t:CDS:1 n=1 Tax=Funneliformis caledonium TaxID=1117310 RepID=A0A9N8VRH8_9GLOM|nr:15855_t:CDS:2 [Funneliformis caledonium]